MSKKLNKETVIRSLIQSLKKKGFKNIKANIKGHVSPDKVSYKWAQKSFAPDVTVEDDNEHTFFYQVHVKILKSEIQEYFQQWILFNSLAHTSGGKLTLVVPKDNLEQIQKLISDKKINAQVVDADSV